MPRPRALRIAASCWRWYANLAGLSVLSLGIGWALVVTIAERGEVVVVTEGPRIERARLYAGEPVIFVVSLRRREACPGEVVQTSLSRQSGGGSVITSRRRVVDHSVRTFEDFRYVEPQPLGLSPGPWRYAMTVESRCPDRTQIDTIADFDIEVQP